MIRSLLFLPGNSPALMKDADILGADALILDLEDAVAPDEKDAARILVRNALPILRGRGATTVVRVNPVDEHEFWKRDLRAVLPQSPDFIMPAKISDRETLDRVSAYMRALVPGTRTRLIPLIETALGVENAFQIAGAEGVAGILLGGEDLTADLGCARTKQGDEIFYARGRIVMAARAWGVECYDTPFTDVYDDDGLEADARRARSLGFSGKACVSPRHIAGVNRAFSPTESELEYAREVLDAIEQAKRTGKGVVSLHGKMIDAPIVNRARQVLAAEHSIRGDG